MFCLALAALLWPGQAAAESVYPDDLPHPSATAALVLDASSGAVVFALNGEQPLPPASTTKIATALLTLSLVADLNELTTVSAAAAAVPEASLYLRAGEVLTVADLLTGALAHSGNDACFALAEAVAGSESLFVHLLDWQAACRGAWPAHFCNTNGLPNDEHLVSAKALAVLTAAALDEEFFAAVVSAKRVLLSSGDYSRSYQNTNKLLWQDEHIVGVKTGTTDAAGPCLVAAWRDGEQLLISVVLDSPDRYGESLALLRFAAAHPQ